MTKIIPLKPENQVFVAGAERHNDGTLLQFLVQAPSHRLAWQVAREAARSGTGALLRDPQTQELHEFPLDPGAQTVRKVLANTAHRRGRPPKITSADLTRLASERGVKLPPRVRNVIEELQHVN